MVIVGYLSGQYQYLTVGYAGQYIALTFGQYIALTGHTIIDQCLNHDIDHFGQYHGLNIDQ